ncbi:hypothetical protein Baya_12659 [Bagarius yarrelli]|uniref:Uncharacterized protein n=1 Tax=Bagarius yarrelli TaxID=175774 RepID=A0A556V3A7_BAGYA|nr:hypothetical protein Baya_12659 [Bagarius yarrelli]
MVENLLSSALIWITLQPSASAQILSECVHQVRTVRGFNNTEGVHFRKRISDRSLANNKVNNKQSEEIVLKLGQLTFQQLKRGNLIYEEDLKECGIDVKEAALYSAVCTQFFREEFGSKVFCFVHPSIQEHLAALYGHLTFMREKTRNLMQIKNKEWIDNISMLDLHKTLYQTGHLNLLLYFLLCLSLESHQKLTFSPETERSLQSKEKIQYIQKIHPICSTV